VPETRPTPPTPSTLEPDRLLAGRYRLVRRLARGGMAEVWEAADEILTRPVAIKILLPHLAADEAFVTRFKREAVAAARLSHPNIVAIYDTWADGGVEAIVMELVRGTTLREILDERGALPPRRAVPIAIQVAAALDAAHRQGLIHRDVKPGNILLTGDGRVLVADFGIAKATEASSDLTEVGQVVGTAKYLSPEQVQGAPLDARSDVYALGVVLYEMLCGQPPFNGGNATATAVARLTSEPLRPRQVRTGIGRSLEAAVLRAMARDVEARFPSAAELRTALERVDLRDDDDEDPTRSLGRLAAQGTTTRTAPVGPPTAVLRPATERRTALPAAPRPVVRRRRRSWLAPAVLLVVVAVTLALVGVLLGRTGLGRRLFGDETGQARPVDPAEVRQDGPLAVAGTASFDPFGAGPPGEHDERLANLTDGDPSSAWWTEQYRSELSQTKPGVGVVVDLQERAELDRLVVATGAEGWAATVYVADERGADLAAWGTPVAEGSDLGGPQEFALNAAEGRSVLLWLTDLGAANRVEISDLGVF
jgi:eukaryotic-like serine/threonine-protein kinase